MTEIEPTKKITARPVWKRVIRRERAVRDGTWLEAPTEEEKQDAIRVLREPFDNQFIPAESLLQREALMIVEGR